MCVQGIDRWLYVHLLAFFVGTLLLPPLPLPLLPAPFTVQYVLPIAVMAHIIYLNCRDLRHHYDTIKKL
jgi:hypothetical protein